MAVGDFNLDGQPDLATANLGNNNVGIPAGQRPGGTFGTASIYPVGASPLSVAVGDFNANGKPDLASANEGANTVTSC